MFFSSRPEHKLILLLELQSSIIRGSLVLMHPATDAVPASASDVLFTESLDIEFRPEATSAYYIKTSLDNVTAMIGSALRNLSTLAQNHPIPKKVSEVHFVLSSPWVISQAKTVTINFDKDTPISPERVHKILEDERTQVSLGAKVETETIEEKVFDVRLNGYSIANWNGKAARTLDISYALSISSVESINKLRHAVAHVVSSKNISMHSSLLLQYISLRNAHAPGDTYMLVHAHGELTDMVVVRHGMCSFFGSYPVGINTIMRKLAEMTGRTTKTADSLLSLYLGHHMEGPDEARAGIAIEAMTRNWTNELLGLADAIRNPGSTTAFMPPHIFVIAHSHEELFESALTKAYPQSVIGTLDVDMTSTFTSAIASIERK
jgi:hypothetical protein